MFKSLNNLHHAYLLVGDLEEAEQFLHQFFLSQGEKLLGSPDYFVYKDQLFGIDQARNLSLSGSRLAFGKRKVFFLAPEKITLEAQNALLKTFEEPTQDTHFFLAVGDVNLVIPTLLSRLMVVRIKDKENLSEAETFLKMSIKERLNFIKKFLDQEKPLSAFLNDLILVLRSSNLHHGLNKVYQMRLISDERGSSPRLILEHLALVL